MMTSASVVKRPDYYFEAYHVSDIIKSTRLTQYAHRLSHGPKAGMQRYLSAVHHDSQAIGIFARIPMSPPVGWALCLRDRDHMNRFDPSKQPLGAIAVQVYVQYEYRRQGVATSLLLAVAPWASNLCVYSPTLLDSLQSRHIPSVYL